MLKTHKSFCEALTGYPGTARWFLIETGHSADSLLGSASGEPRARAGLPPKGRFHQEYEEPGLGNDYFMGTKKFKNDVAKEIEDRWGNATIIKPKSN